MRDPVFSLLRHIAFRKEPEAAHDWALGWMSKPWASAWLAKRYRAAASLPVTHAGLVFPNALGLAAGLDKNGDYIDALGALGFGFIEIGTVTPQPQPGNPTPRLFRLPQHGAIINRMGFNNLGVEHLVGQAQKRRWRGVLGINIGKNAVTPLEQAHQDYVYCLERVYPVADYITINISSPNTKDLRQLQHGDALSVLLDAVMNRHAQLHSEHGQSKPVFVKIAPDMDNASIKQFVEVASHYPIEGVIVSNTTARRDWIEGHPLANEAGGLSGEVMREFADDRLQQVRQELPRSLTVIGAGGVSNSEDALRKQQLGAEWQRACLQHRVHRLHNVKYQPLVAVFGPNLEPPHPLPLRRAQCHRRAT